MGAATSKSPEYERAIAQFTPKEQEQITKQFKHLCGEGKATFDNVQLQKHVGGYLLVSLSDKLFSYMNMVLPPIGGTTRSPSQPNTPTPVSGVFYHNFVISLCNILKGTSADRARLICHLASGGPTASSSQLMQFVEDMTEAYKMTMQTGDEYASWRLITSELALKTFASAMLQDLTHKGVEKKESTSECWFTDSGLENWISNSPQLTHMMDQVFIRCFPINMNDDLSIPALSQSIFPMCEGVEWSKFSTILDIPAILYLNHHLPFHLRGVWRLCFANSLHGESFGAAVKHIVDRGPTLVVVKDSKGYIFGGFAADPWSIRPQFGGNSNCFLFTLHPAMATYSATGYNANFMYLNHGQETLPNGLGMGGQLNYYGLWLDEDYGKGHSKAKPHCTTFNSPQLSESEDFKVDVLEVWALGPEPKKEEEDDDLDGQVTSVLDKDPGAKAMLSLVNKGPLSEGLRESDPRSDIPEEHDLPPL